MKARLFLTNSAVGGCLLVLAVFLVLPFLSSSGSSPAGCLVFHIAFVGRDTPFTTQVLEGLNEELSLYQDVQFDIRLFYANTLDKVQAQSVVEEVVNEHFDLVVSTGTPITRMCLATMERRGMHTPLIHGGSGDPVAQGIISHVVVRDEDVAGVTVQRVDYEELINFILACKPGLKSVLVPHFPLVQGGEIERTAEFVKHTFEAQGVRVHLLPLQALADAEFRIPGLMHCVDMVMCLEGDRVDAINVLLVKLCNQFGVTLFAKELDSVRQGAAFGFPMQAQRVGEVMARQLVSCLVHGQPLSRMPVHFVNSRRRLAINKAAAAQQGLEVTPQLIAFAEHVFEQSE